MFSPDLTTVTDCRSAMDDATTKAMIAGVFLGTLLGIFASIVMRAFYRFFRNTNQYTPNASATQSSHE